MATITEGINAADAHAGRLPLRLPGLHFRVLKPVTSMSTMKTPPNAVDAPESRVLPRPLPRAECLFAHGMPLRVQVNPTFPKKHLPPTGSKDIFPNGMQNGPFRFPDKEAPPQNSFPYMQHRWKHPRSRAAQRKKEPIISGNASSGSTVARWSISTASVVTIERTDASLVGSQLIADRYIMKAQCLGRGGFGSVYPGLDKETDKQLAIKQEPIRLYGARRLEMEKAIYEHMWGRFPELVGYPKVYYQGVHNDSHVLVMERLGKSLYRLVKECGGRFSMKTVLMIGIQALRRLETLHNSDHVHRDIKPDNMATGLDDDGTIYFLDLGLARAYRNPQTKEHGPFCRQSGSGTIPFLSMSVHSRIAATRRDDLESLGFALVYMYNGKLPWHESPSNGRHEETAMEKKESTSVQTLCEGLPVQMQEYFNRVREMEFQERPEYGRLGTLFEHALEEAGYTNDRKFDWVR